MGVRLGCSARLETEGEDTKACYGAIVRDREGAWVAYQRAAKRIPALGDWPGSNNLPGLGMWNKVTGHVARTLGISEADARRLLESYV
jgi:hypothetical protein